MNFVISGFREYVLGGVLFLAVAVVAIGANPWAGQTSTPLDLLASYPGWGRAVDRADVRSLERSDALDARLPQWIYARNELREGRLPLWNDTSAGGDVSLLKLTSGQLTPAFAIFASAPAPAFGFYLSILFNLTFAGLGMFIFLRRHVGLIPALFGGVMFQLCGFNVAWLYWSHVLTFMWAPWLLWATDGLVRERSPKWMVAVATFTALVILGGFPFVAELVLGAVVLYACVFSFKSALMHEGPQGLWRSVIRRGALVACGIMAGFLLAAIPLLTLVQWLDQFSLAHRAGGSGLEIFDHSRLLLEPWAFEAPRVERAMYVGTLGALLGGAGFLLFAFRRHTAGALGLFSLLLALVAIVLTFQLVPVKILSWVPGLGMNAWSRAISLLDLSLAISAAVLLHKLLSLSCSKAKAIRYGVIAVASIGLVVQIYDQLHYYRAFNGPTSAENFYPRTELLDHIVATKGPFDYVVADTSYIISGSLGAYGIREWFAHRFKTQELRRVLLKLANDPFASPTASSLQTANILTESPEMAAMNVRYLLLLSSKLSSLHALRSVPSGKNMSPLPPLPNNAWSQAFVLENSARILKIDIRLATYRATDSDGEITLGIARKDGTPIAQIVESAENIADNKYFSFDSDEELELDAGDYVMSLIYEPGRNARPITAWAGPRRDGFPATSVNKEMTNQVIDYRIHYALKDPSFVKILDDGLVSLWENKHSPNGPYFLSDPEVPGFRETKSVQVKDYAPGRFEVKYTGDKLGYIVVPMEATPDWQVTVNGEPVEHDEVLGVLPAVEVNGPSTIVFRFRPIGFSWLGLWLALTALASGGILAWQRHRQTGRDLRHPLK